MATATRTPQQKRARSITLATDAQYGAHSVRFVDMALSDQGVPLAVSVRVPSRTSDQLHDVTYNVATDSAACDCTAATYGAACCHAGAAILYGREVVDAFSPAATAATRRAQYLATYHHD